MKYFLFVLLWISIFIVAVVMKVFLGDLLIGLEIEKTLRALIEAIPTGICVAMGVALHNRLKLYFKNKATLNYNKHPKS